MSEYHIGCGIFGIYAGKLNAKGDKWKDKTDVTNEAMSAVAQYLLENEKQFNFTYQGKKYIMQINKLVEVK